MWTLVLIVPLSKKIRDKVKQHGNAWLVETDASGPYATPANVNGMPWRLRTIVPVHAGGHPYEAWAVVDKDFRFVPADQESTT